MTSEEYEKLKQFYTDVEESLTLSDYDLIFNELDIPIAYKKTNEWRLKTACHNIDAHSSGTNLQFSLDSRSFFCFSQCNCSYNIFTLIQKRFHLLGENKTSMQCLKWVCDLKGIKFDFTAEQPKNKNRVKWERDLSQYINKKSNEKEVEIYNKRDLSFFSKIYHDDWLNYGISEDTMEKFNIRYYPYRNQIIIPCYDKRGDLIGVRVRNMIEGVNKYMPLKMLNGKEYNFPTNKYFYGINVNQVEIKRTGVVWLVEGEKSVLKANDWFGEKSVVLALYGSVLSKEKIEQLIKLGVDKVIIMIDSDFKETKGEEYNKFKEKVVKIASEVYPMIGEVEAVYNNQGYDGYKLSPFDFTREQFDKMYENRLKIY